MTKKSILSIALFVICLALPAQVTVTGLLTENMTDPIGIDADHPRFSWQLMTDKRNVTQMAYELRVSDGAKTVWNTGKVNSSQSVHISYAGEPLEP